MARKKWRLTYSDSPGEDPFPSQRKAYEFIQLLAVGGTGVVRVWVDEGAGRGWELFERVDLAEVAGTKG